jgi:hypothetical protein
MGANMTPTIKKSGRTVFGVKMGLSHPGQPSPCTLGRHSARTAMPSVAAA